MMKKTITLKKGNLMFSSVFGRYGPYILGSVKVNKNLNVKASIGTRGEIVGAKYAKRRKSISAEHNLTTGMTTFKTKAGKRKLKFKI